MQNIFKVLLLLLGCSLVGCGGSGGGGGSSGSQGGVVVKPAEPGDFSMDTDHIELESLGTFDLGTPRQINIQILGKNVAYLGAAYDQNQIPASWLDIKISGGGEKYQLNLEVGRYGMKPGSYTAAFTVGTADAQGNVLKTKVVTVNVRIKAPLKLQTDTLTERKTYGVDEGRHELVFGLTADAQTQWQVSAADPWVTLLQPQGQGDGIIRATVNYADKLPGTYQTLLTVTDKNRPQNQVQLSYKFILAAPVMTLNYTAVLLGGEDGVTDNSLPLTFSVNTANKQYPYKVTLLTQDGSPWLQADKLSGMAGQVPQTITLRSKPAPALTGEFSGRALVEVQIDQVRLSGEVPVKMQREFNRISLSSNGVHLSSAPDQQLLSRQIHVFSSRNQTDIPWQATSDQAWLQVTATGNTGSALTLTARPEGLAPDRTHFATVTVSSSDASVQNTEQIRVGFTPLSKVPAQQKIVLNREYVINDTHVAFSPVEPLLYVAYQNQISIYDAHDARLLGQYTVALNSINAITVAVDGRQLFVYDKIAKEIAMLAPQSGEIQRRFKVHPSSDHRVGLLHLRNNGESLLLGNNYHIFDTNSGLEMKLSDPGRAPVGRHLSASYSPYRVSSGGSYYDVRVSALNNYQLKNQLHFISTHVGEEADSCQSYDGQYAYLLGINPAQLARHHWRDNTTNWRRTHEPFGRSLQCSVKGQVIVGVSQIEGQPDVFVYNAEGTLLQQLELGYSASLNRIRLSADGAQLAALSYGTYDDGTVLRLYRLKP